jgi:PTH1 family peptidyl-tRNA hydrolase
MGQMKMVVGLGNPGAEFVDTRHNIGFGVIDSLAEVLGIDVGKRKFSARLGSGEFGDKKLILLKPWQFMNRSGEAVAKAVGFYKLPLGEMLVVTDDIALEPGRIRIRAKGSAGGHNGLADIIDKLGANQFARLRVGIGRSDPRQKHSGIDYVLDRPTRDERRLLDEAIDRARQAALCWLEFGIGAAMNKFNRSAPARRKQGSNDI